MEEVGFELRLSYTTVHTASSVAALLRSTIAAKDVPDNDVLLITAGGVDRAGCIHPAEELVAELLVEAVPVDIGPLQHLQRVYLHRWFAGDAWELYPEVNQIVAPSETVIPQAPGQHQLTLEYPSVPLDPYRMERNQPCLCGSGRKAKHCHLQAPST